MATPHLLRIFLLADRLLTRERRGLPLWDQARRYTAGMTTPMTVGF